MCFHFICVSCVQCKLDIVGNYTIILQVLCKENCVNLGYSVCRKKGQLAVQSGKFQWSII